MERSFNSDYVLCTLDYYWAMISLEQIRQAVDAVYEVAHRTPLLYSAALSERFGGEIYLKAESLQHTGSFKVRGAANRLAALTAAERARGVIAASAGNHAQGVAVAARRLGVKATVVMPERAALAKVQAARRYGAQVILHGEDFDDSIKFAKAMALEANIVFIPAFDDERVIAGQGTLGLEILEDCPGVETVIVPVGGGGLIAGVATAVKALRPQASVIGVQAAAAPATSLSFQAQKKCYQDAAPTIADGVAVGSPGDYTLPLLQRYLDACLTVDEEAIAQAIVLLIENAKLVVEGAGALAIAAMLTGAAKPAGKTVAVLSGGNIDINMLATIVQRGLLHENRYLNLRMEFEDSPGQLARLLAIVAATGANVLDVDHLRQDMHLPLRGVEVHLLLETRDLGHIEDLTRQIADAGYLVTESTSTTRAFRPVTWH
jgi:threonine dehydratase